MEGVLPKIKSAIRRWLLRRLIPTGVIAMHIDAGKESIVVAMTLLSYEDRTELVTNYIPPFWGVEVTLTAKGTPYVL